MRQRRTTQVGTCVAALAVAIVSTGCLPVPPTPPGPPPPASLQIKPSPAKFPTTPPPYSPMPIVTVSITNTSQVAVRSIVVHPVDVYSVPRNTCSTLAPGHSCTADVQFCPTSPHHYLDTLIVTGNNAVSGTPVQATTTLDGTAT